MAITTTTGAAYLSASRMGIREIVRRLNAALGPTLVAGLAGAKDKRISHKWAPQDGPEPNPAATRRLMDGYRAWSEVPQSQGEHVARLWFIGSNPWLGEDSPVEALMEDRFKVLHAAVQAMTDESFAG
jgi:hypothetical protein